jgi:hypothetical protein
MIEASNIRKKMEVVGSDGGQVGRVDHVFGREIEVGMLEAGSGSKPHVIPLGWVDRVEGERVCLSLTERQAKARWKEKTKH